MKKVLLGIILLSIITSCRFLPKFLQNDEKDLEATQESSWIESQEIEIIEQITPSLTSKVNKVDSRLVGTWSALQKENVPDNFPGEFWVFREDGRITYFHTVQSDNTYFLEESTDDSWQTDGNYLYIMYTDVDVARLKIKYTFLSENTLEITFIDGSKYQYIKESDVQLSTLQRVMQGKWECEYDLGFGETGKAFLECDDFSHCTGPKDTPSIIYDGYMLGSDFEYFYYYGFLLPENNYSLVSDMLGSAVISSFSMWDTTTKYSSGIDYTFTDSKMNEFTISRPQWEYYNKCKKIEN